MKGKKMDKGRSQAAEVWKRLRRNKMAMVGLFLLILLILCAVFADWLAPYGYDEQDVMRKFTAPCREFPLGTDNYGRCILSRIIYGSRISLEIGLVSVGISAVFGSLLGAVAGYFGGKVDNAIMRILDVMMAIPSILMAIAISASLGAGLQNAMIAVGVTATPGFARVVRASALSVSGQEYIEASRAINAGNRRIILRHVIPNVMAPIIVQATLGVASAILQTAMLSFIGLGAQPPVPDWGSMLSAGRIYLRDFWYMSTFPGVAIMLTIFSLNILGDGLRDALDPRMKG